MKRERRRAIVTVFLIEIAVSLGAAALVGALLIPAAHAERGYFAIGGEWLALFLVAAVAYKLINDALFRKIEREAKTDGRNKDARRKVSGNRNQLRVIQGGAARCAVQARMDYQQRGRC